MGHRVDTNGDRRARDRHSKPLARAPEHERPTGESRAQRNLTVSVPRMRVRTRRASSRLSTRPPNAFQKSRCLLELYLAVPIALNGVRVGAFLLCFNAFLVVGAPLLAVPAQHLWLAVRSERGHCMCRRRRRALSSHEAADGPAVVVAPSCEPAVAASSRRLESGRRRWRPLLRRSSVLAPCAGRGVAAEFGPGVGGRVSRSFEAAPRVLSRGGSSRAVARAPSRGRGHTPPPLPLSSRWAFGLSRETGAAPSSPRRRALVSRVAYGAFPSSRTARFPARRALSLWLRALFRAARRALARRSVSRQVDGRANYDAGALVTLFSALQAGLLAAYQALKASPRAQLSGHLATLGALLAVFVQGFFARDLAAHHGDVRADWVRLRAAVADDAAARRRRCRRRSLAPPFPVVVLLSRPPPFRCHGGGGGRLE